MIVFDTEDNSPDLMAAGGSGFDKEVCQIAALGDDGEEFWNKGDAREFLAWVRETGQTRIYAHNLQYDLGNLCTGKRGLALDAFDLTMVGGRLIRARLGGLTFLDSYNLWPMSAAKIGAAVGLEKMVMNVNSREYVFRDCEIILRALLETENLGEEFGIETLPATLGGFCVKLFAALGGKNWFCDDLRAKAGYYGGRVEIFRPRAAGQVHYTDINSLYPWAMTQHFPDCFMERKKTLEGFGVADVTVKVPPMAVPPLPFRDDAGRILFPVGKFRGEWTLHEIRAAVELGAKVEKIHWVRGSATGERYYADYIREIYRRRVESEGMARKTMFKLLLNNLYGRLAIGGEILRSLKLTPENRNKGRAYGGRVLAKQKMPLPDFTNYLHAAYVTSYARIRLGEFLRKIPEKNLIYCDTDSAIFEGPEIPFPISADRLGEMKLEGTFGAAECYLPKTYRTDAEYKAKGVPKKHAREFIETGAAAFDLPFKMREAISFYDFGNAKQLSVWRRVRRERAAVYDKKIISKCGKFYLPIKL